MRTRRTSLLAAILAGACAAHEQRPASSVETVTARAVPSPVVAVVDSALPPLMPSDTIMRDSAGRLVLPVTFLRTCEGDECAQSFAALACFAAELHRAPLASAPVVGRIARGDTVQVTRRDLRVLQPGIVVFRRPYSLTTHQSGDGDDRARADTVRFAAGDSLYLLQYLSVGDWSWWHRGKLDSSNEFWASEEDGGLGGSSKVTDTSTAVRLSRPVSEDWWLVAPPTGATGWWLADTLGALRSIDMMEHWEEHCPPRDSAAARSK